VLARLAANFELIDTWTLSTICKLRYRDQFVKAKRSYGDEWFLQSEYDQVESYKMAKDSGLPLYDLRSRRMLLTESKFKNNPKEREEHYILSQLEPYPDLTVEELRKTIIELAGVEVDTSQMVLDLQVKINFNNFIDRFEREQTNIINFGSALDFSRKIQIIKETIYSYVNTRN
jgi:hypothetical protein